MAVAVAAQGHLNAKTDVIDMQVTGHYRKQASSVYGLGAARPGPIFMAYCPRSSPLAAAGLKEADASEWKLGGAEGDQLPLIWL